MNFLKYSALILGLFLTLTSCQEDGGLPGTDATVSQTSSTLLKARTGNVSASANSETGEGDNDCFKFNYPLTVILTDGSSKTVNSDDELDAACSNDTFEKGSRLKYPVTLTVNGSAKVINTDAELDAVLDACHASNDQEGDTEEITAGKECFTVKYPVTIKLPNGEAVKVESREEEMDKVTEYYDANPDAQGEPEFVYPITVVKADGTESVINTAQDLEKLFVSCYGDVDFGEE